jgi:hypothetical protein
MSGIARQAAFYRGHLPEDRCLLPVTVLLSTTVALWLLVYLVGVVADAAQGAGTARVASERFLLDRPTSISLIHGAPFRTLVCDGAETSLKDAAAPARNAVGRGI